MQKGIYIMNSGLLESVFDRETRNEIETVLDIDKNSYSAEEVLNNLTLLEDVDYIIGSWGMLNIDDKVLRHAKKLKAVFYAAGSVKYFVTDAMLERGIMVSSAYSANAIPVAEYTLAMTILGLKRVWHHAMKARNEKKFERGIVTGCYRSTVGLISLGSIALRFRELLRVLDVNVLAYSSNPSQQRAKDLDLKFCTLEEIFQQADVISLHSPLLKETEGMIQGRHFQMMKPNSTFINTARGAIVKENEMIEILRFRSDICAVLDVTNPEPPEANSLLYELPNILLTPHIAGSMSEERKRMGALMLEEMKRHIAGEPLEWQITREMYSKLA